MHIDLIPLSGPSVSYKEIQYAADAAERAWNSHARAYVATLQDAFRYYTGRRHALAASSGEAALHMALHALGCGPGMEVVVPEIADISVAAAVLHIGATPVFCDVDPLTLCITAETAASKITRKTVGIIPVHLYGQLCDMLSLTELAKRYNVFIVEEATQGLGGTWNGARAGTFGHVSVFGLDPSGAVAAPEGGMLLTSIDAVYEKAAQFGNNGKSPTNPFRSDAIGFNYTMSNASAAFAVGQMERLFELMEKKKTIQGWYAERLADVPSIRLNPRVRGSENSFWMSVLFFERPNLIRRDLVQRLFNSKIVCEPAFFPLSSMPMFERAANPVAYNTGLKCIVLPSGHDRTEEEVDYVCEALCQLLSDTKRERADVPLKGWMALQARTRKMITRWKKEGLSIPFEHHKGRGALRLMTVEDTTKKAVLDLMVRWRNEFSEAFLERFEADASTFEDLLKNYPEKLSQYMFFFIEREGNVRGQVALSQFDAKKHSCAVETLIMEKDSEKGLASTACKALYAWLADEMGIRQVYAHILGSNMASRMLNSAVGFTPLKQVPLHLEETERGTLFRPMFSMDDEKADDSMVISVKSL